MYANTISVDSKDATLCGTNLTDKLIISAIDHVVFDSGTIDHLTANSDNSSTLVDVHSYGDIAMDYNTTIRGKTELSAFDSENRSEVANKIDIHDNLNVNNDLLIMSSGDVTVGKKLTVAGDTSIISQGDVVINKIETQTLAAISSNTNITTLTTDGDAGITTINDTTIANGTVGGGFTNTSNNTTITGKLDVTGDTNITASNDVVINEIETQTLTANANNANITTLQTQGNTEINTSGNTQIADTTVGGDFTNTSNNTTLSNKLNVAKNADITAKNNVKITDANIKGDLNVKAKKLNIGKIKLDGSIDADVDSFSINTPFKTKSLTVDSDDKVVLKNFEVDYLDVKTKSSNIDFEGKVNKRANFVTNNKRISVNNENFEPDYYATAQLYTSGNPFRLIIDGSKDVKTTSNYIVRHNENILINGSNFLSSIESESVMSSALTLKDSNEIDEILKESINPQYNIHKLSDDSAIIRAINSDVLTPQNIFDVINTGNNLTDNVIDINEEIEAMMNEKISCQK